MCRKRRCRGCCHVQRRRGIQPGRDVRRPAQAAQDDERRTFFNRQWDSWVRVANNYQIAESLAADDAPPRPVGMIMSGLEAAEAPPER